jgi:Uri superfamily endonuclease
MKKLAIRLKGIGPSRGTYVLVVELDQPKRIQVGRLGFFNFKEGTYLYTGSALGPGGLAGRIHRHLRPETQKRPHWHIDALTAHGSITDIWWSVNPQRQECVWAETLSMAGDRTPPGFGASDCHCTGHLIWLQGTDNVDNAWNALRGLGLKIGRIRNMVLAI